MRIELRQQKIAWAKLRELKRIVKECKEQI